MAKAKELHCSVITPERQVFDAGATQVIVPAHDGQIGILNQRAPLLCELGQGDLRIDTVDEGSKHITISGGFAQVLDNQVIVLTEKAEEADEN